MPLVPVVPDKVREVYFEAVRAHNATKHTSVRMHNEARAHGALAVIEAVYGSTAAGEVILDADRMVMAEVGEDALMCGGILLDMLD